MINVNLKKYAKQVKHYVTDLKVELLVKIVNLFRKKRSF